MKEIIEIFGDKANFYFSFLNEHIISYTGTKYYFENNEKFKSIMLSDPLEGSYIYWKEMLCRAHFTAVASIYRNLRWIEGIVESYKKHNFFSFAASYRGFVESASDAYDGLDGVPLVLAKQRKNINNILKRKTNSKIIISEEVEEKLIHFSHGRKVKKGETVPDSHRAKPVWKYLKTICDNETLIAECYSYLCQITHPSALSVLPVLKPMDNDGKKYIMNLYGDEKLMSSFLSKYSEISDPLLNFAFNPSMVTLKLLNSFMLTDYHSKFMDKVNMNDIKVWKKIKFYLK